MWHAGWPWHPRWHWRSALLDILPAAVLLAAGELDVAFGLATPIGAADRVTATMPVAVVCVAIVFRRHWPLTTLGVVMLALVLPGLLSPTALTYWGAFVPWLVAVYSVARHLERRMALIGLGVSTLGFVLLMVLYPELSDVADALYNGVLLAAAWLLGLFARSWSEYRERTMLLEFERGQAEERASREERTRIARELHDVIAHTITVIVMAGRWRPPGIRV